MVDSGLVEEQKIGMEANIKVADVESSDLSSEEGKLKMKCLLVNDCPKKLLMMTSVLKLANFEVD